MDLVNLFDFKKIRNSLKNPFYKNSFFLMVSYIVVSLFGFIFWIVAAKVYTPEEVGVGTAILSAISLICLFSYFGFDQSIIRYFPEKDKSIVFSTSVSCVWLLVIITSTLFFLGIDILMPSLGLLKDYILIFICIALLNAIASLAGISFVALRKARLFLIQNIVMGSRILLLLLFVSVGSLGIVYSFGSALLIALIISGFFISKSGIEFKGIDINYLKESFNFSIGNYLSSIFSLAPNYILPIMVLAILGSENTAYFYISFTMASILFMIPNAISTSLFVEGSHGAALKKNVINALIFILGLLTAVNVFLYFLGASILGIIGKDYVLGLNLLLTLALSSYFVSGCQIYFSIKKIKKDIKTLIWLNGMLFTLIILFSSLFMVNFGIIGIGYAWMVSYGLTCLVIGVLAKKELMN